MKYVEISVEVNSESADIVSTAMFAVGVGGVEIEDPSDYEILQTSDLFWDYVDEDAFVARSSETNKVVVKTVVPWEDSEKIICKFEDELGYYLCFDKFQYEITTKCIEKNNWNEEWKKHFKPIRTTKITIIPIWDKGNYLPNMRVLRINPSIAFGSGEHATTRMCLEYMEVENKDVIDVGCGSGILGLSAMQLGAKSAILIDIDEDAIRNATENAKINNITNVKIRKGDLLLDEKADVIFANLTADILIRLSRAVSNNLREDGKLVVSGIIVEREVEVVEEFKKAGFIVVDRANEDTWVAMVLKKNAN